MPELAEVEWYRRQWNEGLKKAVTRVALHPAKRIFRGTATSELKHRLTGTRLLRSEARGKRLLFRFSNDNWLGVYLGMSGKLQLAAARYRPGKHDHFVIFQNGHALVFRDARQFGRVQFHHGKDRPVWWSETVPEIASPEFNRRYFDGFLQRHLKAPIKAVLLMQRGFSGIGNWMADEILWRARVLPAARTSSLDAATRQRLFRATRFVARAALRIIGGDYSDPPRSWLIHERWRTGGKCPRDGTLLQRATVGGRTTAWCPRCQR